jgi:hypothetical protein
MVIWGASQEPLEFYPFSPQGNLREVHADHLPSHAGLPEVSAESVQAAKDAQADERRAFTDLTGCGLDEDGRIARLVADHIWFAVNGSKR